MFRQGLCAVVLLVVLTVSLADDYSYSGDPREERCTNAGGHCHPEGDDCKKYGEADIGPCHHKGRCCKCIFDSHKCTNAGGHCRDDSPCSKYGEKDIGPCCGHGRCCQKSDYRDYRP